MKSQDLIYRLVVVFNFILLVTFVSSCSDSLKNNNRDKNPEDREAEYTDFAGSAKYLFDLLKNPVTGRIPEGIRAQEVAQAKDILKRQQNVKLTSTNTYLFQGPQNLAGRTRAVVYDKRYNGTTNSTIISGGVSGGIYKSTDNGFNWSRKSPTDAIYSVTSIAQDTRVGYQDVWYYSTGEAGALVYAGDGIYKSVNNGESWTKLPASNPGIFEAFDRREDYIWKVIVNPVNGDVYMAAVAGIYKSANGGATWTRVLSGTFHHEFQTTDIVVTSSGRLFAAFGGPNTQDVDGVWTSSIGDPGTWGRIAGEGPGGSPTGWNAEDDYGRIVLAIAPNSENFVYALVQVSNGCPGVRGELFCWNHTTATWTDLSNYLPGCSADVDALNFQSGYDMVIAVKPDDPNTIFIGGTSLYRSTDGFTTTDNITQIGGYNNFDLHPDMHSIAFEPGNPAIMLCGNDGGIQKTPDNLAGSVIWWPWNYGCRTFQYYYVTLDPRTGSNKVLGGAQDNGTTRNINESGIIFESIFGGDGVSVGLSNSINGFMYEYCGYQIGHIGRKKNFAVPNVLDDIRPATVVKPNLFVTLFKLDPDNTEFLYYVYGNSLYRTDAASTVATYSWTELTGVGSTVSNDQMITALATTRGNYSALNSSLFIGDWNGKVYRLDDPVHVDPSASPVNITSNILDGGYGGNVSSISVNPRNDDTVLVTVSNYGVTSIWWTGDANAANPTWVNVEQNLTLPSIRSSAIAVIATGVEYFVGTSVGLYKTTDPLTQDWTQEGASDIGFAVVTSLALRPSDNRLLVGTYGYGMWATTLSTAGGCSTNAWIGSVSDAWENTLNWSCGLLPNADTHVIINYGHPFNPKISSNVTIKELTLDYPGLITVRPGYKLDILNQQ